MLRSLLSSPLLLLCAALLAARGATAQITLNNPGFGPVGGGISGVLDLNVFDGAPASITQQLGSSGWYGQSNATTLGNLGFRPGVSVDSARPGAAFIDYGLGASLGTLAGLEMPAAYVWQPLSGSVLAANTTYTLSIDIDTAALLNVSAFTSRGFGLGLTVGASTTSTGTFIADTLSDSSLLRLDLLGGSLQRMTMSYTTGAVPPAGVPGFAIFAGRGVQALQVALLDSYQMDNASMSAASSQAVPEPSTLVTLVSGLSLLFLFPRRRPFARAKLTIFLPTISIFTLAWLCPSSPVRALSIDELGIPIPNGRFDFGEGEITQKVDLAPRNEAFPEVVTKLGTSGWYAKSCPSCLDQGGHFRPGIAVHHDAENSGGAIIRRQPQTIPHGVKNFCQSEAWMWVPAPGVSIESSCHYALTVDVDTGKPLDNKVLAAQGFGIGLATGSSASNPGTLFADSDRLPTLVDIALLRGTRYRVSLSFTTGVSTPTGDLSVVIFTRKAPVILPAEDVRDYRLDNVALIRRRSPVVWSTVIAAIPSKPTSEWNDESVTPPVARPLIALGSEAQTIPTAPEPSTAVLVLTGCGGFLTRRFRPAVSATCLPTCAS